MRMFATDYTVPVFCAVCNVNQQDKPIACFYSDTEGYYVEVFVCFNCLETITDEVKKHGNKIEKNVSKR